MKCNSISERSRTENKPSKEPENAEVNLKEIVFAHINGLASGSERGKEVKMCQLTRGSIYVSIERYKLAPIYYEASGPTEARECFYYYELHCSEKGRDNKAKQCGDGKPFRMQTLIKGENMRAAVWKP